MYALISPTLPTRRLCCTAKDFPRSVLPFSFSFSFSFSLSFSLSLALRVTALHTRALLAALCLSLSLWLSGSGSGSQELYPSPLELLPFCLCSALLCSACLPVCLFVCLFFSLFSRNCEGDRWYVFYTTGYFFSLTLFFSLFALLALMFSADSVGYRLFPLLS